MFVSIIQPFQLCHLPGQPHHSGQVLSHGQVQLAPGRAWQSLAFNWKVEKASACTAKQDKAPLFPSHDPLSLKMWRVFQGKKMEELYTFTTPAHSLPLCSHQILCTFSLGQYLAPAIYMNTSTKCSESNQLSIFFCNYLDFLDIQHV